MGLPFFMIFLSLLFFVAGIMVHTGRFKGWWLVNSNPVTPTGIFYVLIPAGLWFLSMGILMLLPITPSRRGDVGLYIFIPLIILIVVLGTWQPSWLTPKWLRWLQTNYPEHLQLLHDEASRMDRREWNRSVRTQEGLESWVEEVLNKNNISPT